MKKNRTHSRLSSHNRSKKILQSPWNAMRSKIGNKFEFFSWVDLRLPDLIWLSLARKSTDQATFVKHCHSILKFLHENKTALEEGNLCQPTHSNLAKWPNEVALSFTELAVRLFGAETFSPLNVLHFFPDSGIWARSLSKPYEKDWHAIAGAVAMTLDHQSESSTDIRWFLLSSAVVVGKMLFPPEMKGITEEIRLYPSFGDQRKVRPMIRSTEMAMRQLAKELDANELESLCKSFWAECYKSTPCTPTRFIPKEAPEKATLKVGKVESLYHELLKHRQTKITETKLDPRSDSVFGLSLYGTYLLWSMTTSGSGNRLEGRMLLRALFETFCTLRLLLNSTDTSIWAKYRNYGSGQAKLFLLKMEEGDFPKYVTEEELASYVNEDFWMEYLDIDLGAWSKTNLRETCEQLGIKDLYDKYYIWTSGYVHAHWMAVRDSLFAVCTNPLHRLHRIPVGPRFDMPSTLIDGMRIVNLILEEVDRAYPTFQVRLRPEAPEL